jgi:hypothetical protein
MSWTDDLQKLCTKGGHDLGELAKAIKIEAFSGIVSDTRVADPSTWKNPVPGYVGGRLRGNWQIQENTQASGELERTDPSGAAVTSEVNAKSTEDGLTYFVNNLPYAAVYEEKDGMVQRNVERVKAGIKLMADKLR